MTNGETDLGPGPADSCLALLLDGPLQSWGYASRFERRTTALHPTRSAVLGIVAAALGIDKHAPDEREQLARLAALRRLTVVTFNKRDARGQSLPMRRLEDYHTVTGIRRASGKVDAEATVQTYRHYLLDARFGVLIDGPAALLEEIAAAIRDPRWGVWLGRKCCLPASPLLAALSADHSEAWASLLRRAGYSGTEAETEFDRVVEAAAMDPSAEMIEDTPVAFGAPIGERHAPRWVIRSPKSASGSS